MILNEVHFNCPPCGAYIGYVPLHYRPNSQTAEKHFLMTHPIHASISEENQQVLLLVQLVSRLCMYVYYFLKVHNMDKVSQQTGLKSQFFFFGF